MILSLEIIGWAIFIYSVCCIFYALITEKAWQGRVKISYSNYTSTVKYFNYKTPKLLPIIFFAYSLFTIVYIIVISYFNELNVFIYISIIGIAITAISTYFIISRSSKNRDLSSMNQIYDNVTRSYQNIEDIEKKRLNFTELHDKFLKNNETIVKEYLLMTNNPIKLDLTDSLGNLEDIIKQCDDILNDFDNTLSKQFNDILFSFLKQGYVTNLNVNNFNTYDKDVKELTNEIIEKQKQIISDYVETIFINKYFMDDFALLKIIDLTANKLNIPITQKIIDNSVDYLEQHENIRKEVIELFQNKKFLDNSKLTDLIVKKSFDWILSYSLIKQFGNSEHLTISEYLIENDKKDLVIDYLMTLNKQQATIVPIILNKVKSVNKSKEYFETYQKMINNSVSVDFSSVSKLENIHHTLLKYSIVNHDIKMGESLQAITNSANLELHEMTLNNIYQNKLEEHKSLFELSFRLFFIWINSVQHELILSQKNTIDLSNELQTNLKISEIVHLNLLIIGFILSQKNSESVLSSVLDIYIEMVKKYKTPIKNQPVLEVNNSITISEEIMQFLNNTANKVSTINIVNRIEKDRLLMRKIEKYKGGKWT